MDFCVSFPPIFKSITLAISNFVLHVHGLRVLHGLHVPDLLGHDRDGIVDRVDEVATLL